MDNDEQLAYAPQPGEIRKVIVLSPGKASTYQDLVEAVTAVYRLDKTTAEAVRLALELAAPAAGGSS
jgi:hypothetical protein